MNYETMKALMEASREESEVRRISQITEFPQSESRPDLDAVAKERIAA
jgi:hypothetical protein